MTIRSLDSSRSRALALVRPAVPDWLDVSAQEDPMRDLVTVRLRPSSAVLWALCRGRWKRQVLTAAAVALAEMPAGVMVRIEWR